MKNKKEIMSEWKTYKLGDIADKIGSGATPRGGKEAYLQKGDYSLIRSQNVLDFAFSKSGLAYISEKQAIELRNVTIQEDDILLNITGDSVARVCQVPKEIIPARVNQHVAIIRGKKEVIDQSFLKYYLLEPSFKSYMLGLASSGATRNALTKVMIENFEIQAPKLKTQKEIAQILSSLDDKIELLQQMNQTLENIAQAIFKEWFVDFNFPGFDGELVDGLPKGWKECILKDFGKIVCGKTPSKAIDEYFGGEYMFIKIPDMHNTVFVINTNDTLTEEGVNSQSNKTLPAFSICVSSIATVGLVCINPKPCQTNQQINAIVPKDSFLKYYLYFLALSMKDTFVSTASGGTATLNMNTSQFSSLSAIYPHNDILIEFDEKVSPLMVKILENQLQIQTLIQTRDTLLPRLMSGKIRLNFD